MHLLTYFYNKKLSTLYLLAEPFKIREWSAFLGDCVGSAKECPLPRCFCSRHLSDKLDPVSLLWIFLRFVNRQTFFMHDCLFVLCYGILLALGRALSKCS